MIEQSHKQQETWYSLEALDDNDGTLYAHLLVRWDELHEIRQADEGELEEYSYSAMRLVIELPVDVRNLADAEIYINEHASGIVAKAQALVARERNTASDEDHVARLRDMAIGQNVNAAMHPERQWGIIRKQVLVICQSLGIEPNEDFMTLNAAVEAAKQ